MSRVYWDTMLFIYLLEDHPVHSEQVASIYRSMRRRGDQLCASIFTIAELLVGPKKLGDRALEEKITRFFESGEVKVFPFDLMAAKTFAEIRARGKVSPADAIHLACAAGAGTDLYLTNDMSVRKLNIPRIQFIDDLNTTVLGAELE